MQETIERNGITIELFLNNDGSVNCKRKMKIKFEIDGEEIIQHAYPEFNPPTINAQFELAEATKNFEKVYIKRIKNEQ